MHRSNPMGPKTGLAQAVGVVRRGANPPTDGSRFAVVRRPALSATTRRRHTPAVLRVVGRCPHVVPVSRRLTADCPAASDGNRQTVPSVLPVVTSNA